MALNNQARSNANQDNTFRPQLGDLDHAQKKLKELEDQIKRHQIKESQGLIERQVDELEKMYAAARDKVKETASNSEQAISEIEQRLEQAWDNLKSSVSRTKNKIESNSSH